MQAPRDAIRVWPCGIRAGLPTCTIAGLYNLMSTRPSPHDRVVEQIPQRRLLGVALPRPRTVRARRIRAARHARPDPRLEPKLAVQFGVRVRPSFAGGAVSSA